ncbi:MAG: SpoIIE family protein phosphatase, partial [Bdellovibrionales bacterium]|nr:SpoIIE family protein phosphatase [Bdellovibrionales bacterium]
KGYSSTVIQKVFESGESLIFTGSDEGEALQSKSIVMHNLKSIMVVPMVVGGEFMGIAYVDSSLAKGLFNESDLEVFRSLATQVAVGIKNARLADQEALQRELQKDLELTAAVQNMFLPRTSSESFGDVQLHAQFRPAALCSGDWWWYRRQECGSVCGIIADVTGHGAGPAMLTASVATCFILKELEASDLSLPDTIKRAHETIHKVASGEYLMSLFAFQINPERTKLEFWSAGHPLAVAVSKNNEIELFGSAGRMLGMSDFKLGYGERSLGKGDRIFLYSDGLTETMVGEGRMFGERRLMKFLTASNDLPGDKLISGILQKVDDLRETDRQDDDITCLVVDVGRS